MTGSDRTERWNIDLASNYCDCVLASNHPVEYSFYLRDRLRNYWETLPPKKTNHLLLHRSDRSWLLRFFRLSIEGEVSVGIKLLLERSSFHQIRITVLRCCGKKSTTGSKSVESLRTLMPTMQRRSRALSDVVFYTILLSFTQKNTECYDYTKRRKQRKTLGASKRGNSKR